MIEYVEAAWMRVLQVQTVPDQPEYARHGADRLSLPWCTS